MSWSISLKVENGEATITGASTGDGAPPDGLYTINGHVHHGNDAQPAVGVSTPMGGVNAYLTDQAVDIPAEAEQIVADAEQLAGAPAAADAAATETAAPVEVPPTE